MAGEAQAAGGCCCIIFVVLALSMSSLPPNQFGIKRSYLSGTVDYKIERGGIFFTGPFTGLITFPAAQVTLEFSRRSPDHGPVTTRTGADPHDPDSGGQPITISCAIQYEFMASTLRQVYLAFNSYQGARNRYLLLAGNTISNTAQKFTPQQFWEARQAISAKMLHEINETLYSDGYVMATRFELMKVDFAKSFEDSITSVQVAEQQKVVNEYEQQVQQVNQSIEVLKARNDAAIANISSGAQARSKEIMASAKRDAFHLQQKMKARKYKELQANLSFSPAQMREYFKIKSVQNQGQKGKVVVGMPPVGTGR